MHKVWTIDEELFIKENAGVLKDVEIARQLTQKSGRSVSLQAVRKKRQSLGIPKKPGRGICQLVDENSSVITSKVVADVN